MIKYRFLITLSLLLAFTLSGCYDNETITSELGVDNLQPEDSDDPVDHYIYEFYKKYGTYINYTYDTLDYQWDFNTLRNNLLFTEQENKEVLFEGINFLRKVFIDIYPEDFKKEYFPMKILLASSIDDGGYEGEQNKISEHSSSYIALGRISEGIENASEEDIKATKASLNYSFWYGYLLANSKLTIPDAFYKQSEGFYGVNLKELVSGELNPYAFGFFLDTNDEPYTGGSRFWAPAKEEDAKHFINMITSHTKAEMDELMAGHQKLQDKYNILINHIKNTHNFDLQEIMGE